MKLFKKVLSTILSFGMVFTSALSLRVFAGGDNESGFSFGRKIGEPVFKDKQEDIMFDKPLKWGKIEILGVPCNWEKTDSFKQEISLPANIAGSKLIKGIFTNNLELVKEGVAEGARITQYIEVITSDKDNKEQILFITDLKEYMSAEITDYLRKAYNTKFLAERKLSRQYGYGFGPEYQYGPGQHSYVHIVRLFDGDEPLKIEEYEIDKIAEPIDFLNTKIVGFIKGWNSHFCPLDKNACEKLVRGILTDDLNMVKSAVESNKSIIRIFPVVTSEGLQIDFEPFVEAGYCKNKEIIDYLSKVHNDTFSFNRVAAPKTSENNCDVQ